MDSVLAQARVRKYWGDKPCDSDLSDRDRLSREYFLDIERWRYELQPHILEIISRIDWRGKRVLEIGSGVGTDARNIAGVARLLARRCRAAVRCDITRFPGQHIRCGVFVRGAAPHPRS